MSTRTFGTGHVIPIIAQSEHEQALYHSGGLARPPVAAETVQLWSRQYLTNANPTLIEVPQPIQRWHISDETTVSAAAVAMANTLALADPDARWCMIFAVKGGTSIAKLVNDDLSSLAAERAWGPDQELIMAATENMAVGPSLVPFVWGTSASGNGYDAADVVGRFLTGRHPDGSLMPAGYVLNAVYETGTTKFDHTLREWFGDEVKFALIGPHRYETYSAANRTLPLNFAPEIYASAEMYAATSEQGPMRRSRMARQSLRSLLTNTAPGYAGRFVGHFANPIAYLNGAPDATDLVHPRKVESHDGSPLFLAQTAQCITKALGLQDWQQPVIDQVTWVADGSSLEIGTSAGDLTTTRRKLGLPAMPGVITFGGTDYPVAHRTEVVGVEINGRPYDNAVIVGGKIRVTPPAWLGRNFVAGDRARFGMGGAHGGLAHGYDVVAGIWRNWPVLDVTLEGVYDMEGHVPAGIALEPAPLPAAMRNTIAPTGVDCYVPSATRFVDKSGVPGATTNYENSYLGGSGLRAQLALEFSGKLDATQTNTGILQLMGTTDQSVNVAVRGNSGGLVLTVRDGAGTNLLNNVGVTLPVNPLGNQCVLRLEIDLSSPAAGTVRLLLNGAVVQQWTSLVSAGYLNRTQALRCYFSDLSGSLRHFGAWRDLAAASLSADAYVWIEGGAAIANSHPWISGGTVTEVAA